MNTVYFFTNTIQCEALTSTAHCRQYKLILLELLNDNFIIMDLHQNDDNFQELSTYLGLETATPYVVIKNSLGEVVFQFGAIYMRTKVSYDHETYWDAVKTEIQNILIQYNCI